MRGVLVIPLFVGLLAAQQPEAPLNDVEASVLSRDLVAAYDAAARLDDSIQSMLRASKSDAASQVLTWVPPAWESFLMDQRGFVAGDTAAPLGAHVARLRGAQVKAAAAAGAPTPAGSFAYFYFFEQALNAQSLGNPVLQILGRPFWRAEGQGEVWMSLARPDLLIVAGTRDLAAGILGRVLNGSTTRALPATLPEWSDVDRQAPMWGLRHFSATGDMRGATLKVDSAQRLEVRCQCGSRPSSVPAELQVSQPRGGLWVLRGDASGARGWALGLLGFGEMR